MRDLNGSAKRFDLFEQLNDRFAVFVSLPGNDVELAKAAVRGGADGLKVHLNAEHRASGIVYGTWQEEGEKIRAIRSAVEVPLGVMAGADPNLFLADLPHLESEEFAFINAYAAHIPARVLASSIAHLMPALDHRSTPDEARALASLPGVAFLEASVVDPAEYGQPLTLADLARYEDLVEAVDCPVVVPTQKRMVPEDLLALKSVGVKGVLLGAVVFGKEIDAIETSVRAFKQFAEELTSS